MFQFHHLKIAITFFCIAIFFIPQIKASNQSVLADNSRSDSVDVIDYNIHLNVTDYAGKKISGNCTVSFKSKISNLTQLDLDLQKLTIDSIIQNNQKVSFTYNDQLTIHVVLLSTMNAGDSTAVIVFYHGTPTNDTGGFGGWYWSGDYSFSISVALNNIPHNYGRSWFPCVDNFVERSTYHFSIITTTDKMALCNGELISSVDNGDGTKTWNWQLLQTIPPYLACVAVNKYTPAYGIYYGVNDTIPIQYGAIASDTTKMKNSFLHLPDAMDVFVEKWGSFRWNKIGYCETTVGAMEHATNIAYPYFIVNGQTTNENIMAHELAHNWFGNLVTCRTAEDMWLNEGWAEYCSYIFYEKVYGKEKYNTTVAANHESVVHYAHTTIKDGAYYAVGNVPDTQTYGTTVYYKGADMAHTLRGYLGDSLFFSCIKNYLDAYAFKDASSYNFRDYLTACSGIDLTNFFDDWIFQPGWASFTIDSFNVFEGQPGVFDANVFLRQRLDHAQHFYNEVPLQLSFYDENRNVTTATATISGNCVEFFISLPFAPVYVGLDLNEKISDAQTADLKTIKNIGTNNFVNGKMNLTVNSIGDSVLLRIEHVYAAPDPFVYPIPKLHISQERFWKVDGIIPDGFDASSVISYSGTTFSGGFLDNNLITNSEDSLVLLYKAKPADDWNIETDALQNVLVSHTDKKGNFTINHLKKGYYTFGIYQNSKIDSLINFGNSPCQVVGVPAIPFPNKIEVNVFPNPADESINIDLKNSSVNYLLEIYNLYGVRVYTENVRGKQKVLSVKNWNRGTYLVKISDQNNQQVASQIFIVN